MKGMLLVLAWMISLVASATNLQPAVDQLINHVDPSINMGMVVVDLNTGETLYQRNPSQTFVPASNMKLFSDAAALLVLGPNYRFQSKLSTDATELNQGILKGSLYLYLPGDPSFTQKNIDTLLSPLAQWGIKQIQGDVVLVSNTRVVNAYAPGRTKSDFKYSYGAPIAPVILDENRLSLTVNPGAHVGDPALIELHDKHSPLVVDNQVKTATNTNHCGLDFTMDDDNHLTVHGCIGVGQWAVQQRIAIRNPLRYAQDLVKQHLSDMAIKLNGQVVLGNAPPASLLLSSHVSKPIYQIMADTLKPSDNLYADSLYLHAATKLNGTPLNWQQAHPMVKNFLQQQTGINLQSAALIDGSGLSRQDRLTAEQTVGLLQFLHDHFPLAYEYIAALPVAGIDGTLQRRFRKPTQQGFLRAKTGTMTGVISLSGYLYTANAHTLAFAIFINKTPSTKPAISGQYRALVDNLCDFLLKQKPDTRAVAQPTNTHSQVAFQQQPTEADRLHRKYAQWRQLESAIKRSLQGRAVTVLFRGDQLVLNDNDTDANQVWVVLQTLRKKYPFAIALHGPAAPQNNNQATPLLWVKTAPANTDAKRTWTIRESVS